VRGEKFSPPIIIAAAIATGFHSCASFQKMADAMKFF